MMNSVNTFPVFLNVIILLFSLLNKNVNSQTFKVGDTCRTKGLVSLTGICQLLKNCPSALSNLRSGVQPTLCSTVLKGNAIICCPNEERISETKCRDYQRIRTHKIRLNPLLPVEFVNQDDGHATDSITACAIRPNSLISQGRNAKEDEFPFMAAIGYGDLKNTNWACGGSIISDEFIITAAHCLNTKLGRPRRVLIGQVYLHHPSNETKKSLVAVKEIIIHPEYRSPSKYNDLALLKLAKKLTLSKSILPICLPQAQDRLELIQDTSFSISGWGIQGASGTQSNILLTANIQRYSQATCQDSYKNSPDKQLFFQQGIIRSQMCAADSKNDTTEKRDTCYGDSGGALSMVPSQLTCISYLVGITSFGSSLCGFGSPSVYTNVQSYLDWIESIVWANEIKNQN